MTNNAARREDAAKRAQEFQDFLATFSRETLLKEDVLSQSDRNLLKRFSCAKTDQGGYDIYAGGHQIASIDDHSVGVSWSQTEPPDSQQKIESMLKGTVVYKASFGTEAHLCASDQTTALMAAKCANLVGLKVANPDLAKMSPAEIDAALDKASAGLSKKIEAEWAREQAAATPAATASFVVPPKTDAEHSLVINPSPLDKIEPGALSKTQFNPAAQNTGIASTSAAPAPLSAEKPAVQSPGGPG